MKFEVIVADPPWSFSDKLQKMRAPTKRSAASQYATMHLMEIQELDVQSLANVDGCVLALWVPSTLLISGLSVMHAWGFSMKQTYVWVKTKRDPYRDLRNDLKTLDVDDAFSKANPADMLAFGMGRLFRQTHELALIGTLGRNVYASLDNNSQRSVCFSPNAGHSCKPVSLQDSLDVMFPCAKKLELFARRTRPGWTCIGDGVTNEDVRVSIDKLKDRHHAASADGMTLLNEGDVLHE